MLDVFITVDVEVWCDGWNNLDAEFPNAFQQYVYGPTARGNYGLPYQIDVLNAHGIKGVFFVEPLFSTRFGADPLTEIVGLLNDGKQDVELHLHTEWVDESPVPLLSGEHKKRQYMRDFSLEEQTTLIALGAKLLKDAAGGQIAAFRAGSFGLNRDTLRATAANGIPFSSSYNASMHGLDSGIMPGVAVIDTLECDGIHEIPMTVFSDGTGSLRHAQLTACSFKEMEGLLWQALEMGRSNFVILSHNFELLNEAKNRPDDVVVRRFRQLCSFLDRNRDSFLVRGFQDLEARATAVQPPPLSSPIWKTGARVLEQVYRRRYQ